MALGKRASLSFCLLLFVISATKAEESNNGEKRDREGKLLPIFSVVTFPNDMCASSTTRNGTCFTSSECSNKGGSSSGSCANGFGVCCVFTLGCGDSTSANNSYLVQEAFTTGVDSPCTYQICPLSSDICRIRFDFTTHVLASPPTLAVTALATANNNPVGSALGQCVVDSMSISGSPGSPVICGTNTGYHMILDAREECHEVKFTISSLTTTTRQWDIFVTQFTCGDETLGTAITASVTHLANQEYTACIRRESGYCYICYAPVGAGSASPGADITTQGTFGLSISVIANKVDARIDGSCTSDYVYIPTSVESASATTLAVTAVNKFCGRRFATASEVEAHATLCTNSVPFHIGVKMDDHEVTTGITINNAATMEANGAPGGIIGFRLVYEQKTC